MKGKHLLIMVVCLIAGCYSPPGDTQTPVPPTIQSPTLTPSPSAIIPSPSPTITPSPSSTPDISVCPGKKIIYTYGGLRAACFDQDQVYLDYPIPGAKEGDNNYAISSDGKLVAFANDEGIRIYDLQGNEIATLLEAQNAWTLAWSPDAEYIAYTELIQDPFANRVKFIHVTTQTVSDNYVSDVSLGFSRAQSLMIPSWSPDGQKLAFLNTEDDELYVVNVDCNEDSHMCDINNAIDVPCPELETGWCWYNHAAWAPDSERLVVTLRIPFDGDYEEYDEPYIDVLRIIDLSGNVIEEINPLDYGIMMPERLDWSADGQEILFFAYPPVGRLCTSIYVLVLEDMSIYRVPLNPAEGPHSAMWIR